MSAVGLRQALTNQQNKPIPDPWGLKPAKNWGQRPWLRTRWGHGRGHRLNDARWSADEVRAPLATKREEGSSRIWCLKTVDPLLKFCYLLLGNPLQWNKIEIVNILNESNKFQDFCVIRILREINFGVLTSSKTAIFALFETLNFVVWNGPGTTVGQFSYHSDFTWNQVLEILEVQNLPFQHVLKLWILIFIYFCTFRNSEFCRYSNFKKCENV